MRKVYLDDLPRWDNGRYKGKIKWGESVGCEVRFIYDDIEGKIKIIDKKDSFLFVQYLDNDIFKIKNVNFTECKIGNIIKTKTNNFKININTNFKDNKRNITIIGKEIRTRYKKNGYKENQKYYKYKCNKCGNEEWILEDNLLKGRGCNVCCSSPKKAVLGINTIWDTDRWMCDLGISEEDAKKYTKQSHKNILVLCPDCGRTKQIAIHYINKKHTISCICSDKISYPEKFVFNILKQMNLKFITQLSKTTFKWCEDKKYDFYFEYNNEKYIIETHGIQHYEQTSRNNARTLQEEQYNDSYKKELAILNGIKEENYIVIDCRKSELEFIKQNILNSRLNEIFYLSNVDWYKVEKFALSNRVKEICDIKKKNPNMTNTEISNIVKLDRTTIFRYLKRGTKMGWCNYNEELERAKNYKHNGGFNKKPVEIFKDNKSLGVFPSCLELQRISKTLLGINLDNRGISMVTNGKRKTYKGFTFQYINEIQQSIYK